MCIPSSKGLFKDLDARIDRFLRGSDYKENWKLYRWFKGGVWVLMTNEPTWLQAEWSILYGKDKLYLLRDGETFYPQHVAVIEIEDYT